MNPKPHGYGIIPGMLLYCEEKVNQMQDEKNTSRNGNYLCGLPVFYPLPNWLSHLKCQTQIKVFMVFGFAQ